MKNTRVFALLILSLMMVGSRAPARAAEPTRPNVLFILADDLGWADTTLYGHTKFHQTPNLDRLARRGMLFTRAYSASPLCSPTRSAILTGLSPARTGITTPNCHLPQVVLEAVAGKGAPPGKKVIMPTPPTRLKTIYPTLAKSLQAAGYATGHFGKWHLGPEPYSALQHGFDVDVPHWPGPGPAGSYVAPWRFKNFDHDPAVPDQHIEDRMAREAVTFMERHKDRPFFLNYWMFSVHAPFDAKMALIEKHRARVNPADAQRCPTYAAMIESMDDAVGALLDALDRLKLAERTIIVFTADNGGNMYSDVEGEVPTSNRPLRGGKATVFEGGVRVPAVVIMPGVTRPGARSDAVIQSEDYYPTLMEALALKPASGQIFDGISILPALRGQPLAREATFNYFPHEPGVPDWLPPAVVAHSGDWKLIRIFHGGENGAHRHLLFNLREDIGERTNLAAREPGRVKQLDALIEKFLVDTKAVVPIPNPNFDPAKYQPELEGKAEPKTKGARKPGAATVAPAATKAAPAGTDSSDPLQGWKARACAATVKDGIVTVTGQGSAPFLGVAPGLNGPVSVKFRARSTGGGAGKVESLPTTTRPSEAKSVPFALAAGGWHELSVTLAAAAPLGILRIYLPAQTEAVELDWIEVKGEGKTKRWDF